ncbi:MAG TPA: hypothetical protein VFR81_11660 [Longimicrobium sp.]|nr:hypothetical protein [Longimicrobium sp.]
MIRQARTTLLPALLALAACDGGGSAEGAAVPQRAAAESALQAPAASAAHSWQSNPAGAAVQASGGDSLVMTTGPHSILWDASAGELAPPYTVRATLTKRDGRLHEGVGLIFGGSGLEGPESGQVYSYFLVRGDGSYLVKRRQGAETPVVRDWTAHPAIRRDAEGGGRPNELEVRVGEADVAFLVNGAEVARVPASELSVRGRAGVRAAHDVTLGVSGFAVTAGEAR